MFTVGDARYTAIPVKADLPDLKTLGSSPLVTVLSARTADMEDEKWFDNCLDAFFDWNEDVWTLGFLDGLIISSDSLPSSALVARISRKTLWYAVVPGLDLPVSMSSTLVKTVVVVDDK